LNLRQKADIEFHQNLGKLFYAIAAADNHVKDEEFYALKHIINNEWKSSLENPDNDFINNGTVTIIDTFKWLRNDNEYNAEICYNSFINYKRSHEDLFNKEIKSLIIKTASKITASYSSQNKSELMMLAKLSIEFKKSSN
jgi:hypothetical protein